MSGNPFRRNAPGNVKLQTEEKRIERAPSPFKIGKKEKRVKIQTPPQSPEEVPRRLSAGRVSPPPPKKESSSDDDSDTTATADSDIEQAIRNTRRNSGALAPPGTTQNVSSAPSPVATPGPGAPYNPFARTLASSEATFGLQRSKDGQDDGARTRPEGGRKGMDVDMFKNILMTGSPAPTPPQVPQPPDSSSNTDTSYISKNSMFDQNYNFHPESPRSSFDHVDYSDNDGGDDEKGGLMGANKERLDDFAPPAPPKPGQTKASRGPHTVSFAEFDDSSPIDEPTVSPAHASPAKAVLVGRHRPFELHRTASDLNKPLPKTPPRSPGLPLETPLSMDTQVSQAPQPPTPTVISPDETSKKGPPPPPPTSRRAAQVDASKTRKRSNSNTTQESNQEPTSPQVKPVDLTTKHAAPPPPPPSRKSKPASGVPSPTASTPVSEAPLNDPPPMAESKVKTMPPPPTPAPRRIPSTKAGSSVHRSPSNASHRSIARSEAGGSTAPPAPPPRRAAGSTRESLDGAANSMSWVQRRSSQNSFESARSGSLSKPSLASEQEEAEGEPMNNDILADMSAFQAEIDALRKQAGGGR